MSNIEIIATLKELGEFRAMMSELEQQVSALEDRLKAHMTESGTDTVIGSGLKVTWKDVSSTRLDTTALKKDFPDIVKEYGKTTTSKRFLVSAA